MLGVVWIGDEAWVTVWSQRNVRKPVSDICAYRLLRKRTNHFSLPTEVGLPVNQPLMISICIESRCKTKAPSECRPSIDFQLKGTSVTAFCFKSSRENVGDSPNLRTMNDICERLHAYVKLVSFLLIDSDEQRLKVSLNHV